MKLWRPIGFILCVVFLIGFLLLSSDSTKTLGQTVLPAATAVVLLIFWGKLNKIERLVRGAKASETKLEEPERQEPEKPDNYAMLRVRELNEKKALAVRYRDWQLVDKIDNEIEKLKDRSKDSEVPLNLALLKEVLGKYEPEISDWEIDKNLQQHQNAASSKT